MADLPRWIPSNLVDSEAMLAAFLAYTARCSPEEMLAAAQLYGIEHASPATINLFGVEIEPTPTPAPIPMRPCTGLGCRRCETRQGGYQFRWFSWK